MSTKAPHPRADQDGDLGTSSYRWNYLYAIVLAASGTKSKNTEDIIDHVDATAPHSGHVDVTGDTMSGQLNVPNLRIGDNGKLFLVTDESAYFIVNIQSDSSCLLEYWDTNRDASNPIAQF